MEESEFIILGAGPTGLGAASRLDEKKCDWQLLEKEKIFGGLAATLIDEKGFFWDKGGHVQFSHYDTFDRYMELALGKNGWLTHTRESWVWVRQRWVPYPFQNNLHRLDPEDRWETVKGLIEANENSRNNPPRPLHFGEWMKATFGKGVTNIFMQPYNYKVWAFSPEEMDFAWVGERVSVPRLQDVMKSVCTGRDEIAWGPNAVFQFPLKGGTGAVWEAIGKMLPANRISLGDPVEHIDVISRVARTRNGMSFRYKHLISTIPLNELIALAPGVADLQIASRLLFSSTHVVGIGLNGQPPSHLKTKCWMYFPEKNSPYYRVTVFSNYSPKNVPKPGKQWSLLTETSESFAKSVNRDNLAEQTIRALIEDGLLPDRSEVCSVVHYHLPMGYPTPFLGRDKVVDPVLRAFEAVDIYSRGRFGAWKYEVANQDHSFAQGYECVERLISGGGSELEPTLFQPDIVNRQRNL
jgi:protoporphyrinogen oxidase